MAECAEKILDVKKDGNSATPFIGTGFSKTSGSAGAASCL